MPCTSMRSLRCMEYFKYDGDSGHSSRATLQVLRQAPWGGGFFSLDPAWLSGGPAGTQRRRQIDDHPGPVLLYAAHQRPSQRVRVRRVFTIPGSSETIGLFARKLPAVWGNAGDGVPAL